jgi:hypothetical protein
MSEDRSQALATSPQALEAFEKADDLAIVAHMTGGTQLQVYVYSFSMDGKQIVGVSWRGAQEIARLVGNIEVLPDIKVEEREDAYYGLVRVKDLRSNVVFVGAARQEKTIKLRSGEEKPNRFAFVQAINKAERNGILLLVDETIKEQIIEKFKASGRSLAIQPTPEKSEWGKFSDEMREKWGKDAFKKVCEILGIQSLQKEWIEKGKTPEEARRLILLATGGVPTREEMFPE